MTLVNPTCAGGHRSIAETNPVVIVLGAEKADDSRTASWLDRWPRARLIVIETTGRESILYELRPHATILGELTPAQLIEAIRQAAGVSGTFANRTARRS